MRILCTRSAKALAEKVCRHLQEELTDSGFSSFSDGEMNVDIRNTVRRKDVYIIASATNSEDLMELFLLINAAKGSSAKSVNVVFAYYGYARQDRKDQHRGAIGAKMVANCVQANGADHVIILDVHANQIQGFFDLSSDLIYGYEFFANFLANKISPNTVVVAPDLGASKRASKFARLLGDLPLVVIDKRRDKPNSISEMVILGEVKGKDCIIIDDMIDTAGTLCQAADHLINQGAKTVNACITHPILSGPAIKRLNASKIDTLWVSDSIEKTKLPNNTKVISCSADIARTINNHKNGISIHIKI